MLNLQQSALRNRITQRTGQRQQKLSSLGALLDGQAINPERIEPLTRQQERMRLLGYADPASTLDGSSAASRRIFEAVVGDDDGLPRPFLEGGARVGNAVCRIISRNENFTLSFGTGLAVAPGLILTNNHVLPTAATAATSSVEFGYWYDRVSSPSSRVLIPLQPAGVFVTNYELDFTIVSLEPAYAQAAYAAFGGIDLLAVSGKALLGESVNIIHHGSGGPQQLSIRNNHIVDTFDHYVHYTTDTQPGASGAPVLNDQWQLAALHHASVQHRTKNGRTVLVNEGIRISSICSYLGIGLT